MVTAHELRRPMRAASLVALTRRRMPMRPRASLLVMAALVVTAVSGCGASHAATDTPPSATPTPTPAPPAGAHCGITISGDLAGYTTIEQLIATSEVVIVGAISEVRPAAWAPTTSGQSGHGPLIETYYVVQVEAVLRGQAADTLVLRQLGGTVAGCTQQADSHVPVEVGLRALMFLVAPSARDGVPTYVLTGAQQGYWQLSQDATVQMRFGPLAAYDGRPLAELAAQIRASTAPIRQAEPIPQHPATH
jgi:hypothetical protein